MVGLWAAEKRKQKRKLHKSEESEITPFSSGKWSSKRASWLLLQDETQLSKAEQAAIQRMHQAQPELVMVQELAQDFLTMIRQRQSEVLSPWLERAEKSKIVVLDGFCKGIHQDLAAVQSALIFEWSNGQTEGQVNRLKNLKRQMYGRANFDLLRKRFLGLPNPP
jgi:transposase